MSKAVKYTQLQTVVMLLALSTMGLIGCQTQPTADEPNEQTSSTASPTATPIELIDLAFATLAPPTIEVIQQTPTPLPTATATPTATPIVYAIQEGDTLLAIAIDNQTTVDEIQILNPDVRPELLSIGQEIELPPPATPVFSSEQPTALPIQINVLSASLFPDGAGGLWVIGEVENSANYFIENLQLELTLYGTGGLAVGRTETWAAAPLIGPNGSTPFGVLFPQKPDGNLQVEVGVASGFASATASDDGRYYFGITADEPEFEAKDEAVTVSGKVTNSGDQAAIETIGLLLAYGSDGRLIGFNRLAFSPALSAGATEDYTTTFLSLGGRVSTVKIQTYSKKQLAQP